ncbi:hypothetical protein N7505_000761 [Penicillium chrysogenum]|uniref:Uncharacterized protein n=1 Tax=Penicillium chrysogenum TaxID=5076 RepID=A0ABQ8WXI9_PENCH|nr:hypothetical protein N7505_000761 [Penicillium chrysogenum]
MVSFALLGLAPQYTVTPLFAALLPFSQFFIILPLYLVLVAAPFLIIWPPPTTAAPLTVPFVFYQRCRMIRYPACNARHPEASISGFYQFETSVTLNLH